MRKERLLSINLDVWNNKPVRFTSTGRAGVHLTEEGSRRVAEMFKEVYTPPDNSNAFLHGVETVWDRVMRLLEEKENEQQ